MLCVFRLSNTRRRHFVVLLVVTNHTSTGRPVGLSFASRQESAYVFISPGACVSLISGSFFSVVGYESWIMCVWLCLHLLEWTYQHQCCFILLPQSARDVRRQTIPAAPRIVEPSTGPHHTLGSSHTIYFLRLFCSQPRNWTENHLLIVCVR